MNFLLLSDALKNDNQGRYDHEDEEVREEEEDDGRCSNNGPLNMRQEIMEDPDTLTQIPDKGGEGRVRADELGQSPTSLAEVYGMQKLTTCHSTLHFHWPPELC